MKRTGSSNGKSAKQAVNKRVNYLKNFKELEMLSNENNAKMTEDVIDGATQVVSTSVSVYISKMIKDNNE